MQEYFSGARLYGEDLTHDEMRAWYADESEAYAGLIAKRRRPYQYPYHALNHLHGFRHLPERIFHHVLGLGSAYGLEFAPLRERISKLTIVDPSHEFHSDVVLGIPVEYTSPSLLGDLPFPSGQFDLVVGLGVLHHIPNVSYVVKELSRCLKCKGYALIREPIVSMGNWRDTRPGLTKHERGIPQKLLEQYFEDAGMTIVTKSYCVFPGVTRLWRLFGGYAYNNPIASRFDSWLASIFAWNYRYHATTMISKIRPTAKYYVLTK
jgi:SAM-dependent methyltransferase